MKAISVRQPHANLILTGVKVEEYRSWRTRHRGPLAIHAASTLDRAAFEDRPELDPKRVKRGVILGVVDVVDCVEEVYGGFAFVLARPRWLREPIPMKGRLNLFDVDIPDDFPVCGGAGMSNREEESENGPRGVKRR